MTRSIPGLLLALCLLVSAGSCGSSGDRVFILISMDTTRADRLGCYGYEAAETPNIDALAAEGVLFEQATTPLPTTLGSHSTMFTGNYPPVHGVRYNGMFTLADESVTLAELFSDAGYVTGGVPAAAPLHIATGAGQGFDEYLFPEDMDVLTGTEHGLGRRADETTRLALDFAQRHRGESFFLWVHYWDPHAPWSPPFPYSSKFSGRAYDGEIAYADANIGELIGGLKELGAWDDATVVLVGDHGEGLYEHGEKTHGYMAYQTTMHVPFIIKPSGGGSGRRVSDPVSLVDVAPTVLDYAGLELPEAVDGLSLRPAIRGGELPLRSVYFESLAGALLFGWSSLEGVRIGDWKLIDSLSPQLFNVAEDPGETVDLAAQEPQRIDELRAELAAMRNDWEELQQGRNSIGVPLSAEKAAQLDALGYLSGSGGSVENTLEGSPEPRDRLHLEPAIHAARELSINGHNEAALVSWQRILQEDPNNRFALYHSARAMRGVGRLDAAFERTKQVLALYADRSAVMLGGEILVQQGKPVESAKWYAEWIPQVLTPGARDHGMTYRWAATLFAAGDTDFAAELVDQAIDEGTQFPSFHVLQAACRARQGREAEALASLETAIAEGYADRGTLAGEVQLAELRAIEGFDALLATIPEPEEGAGDASGTPAPGAKS